MLTLQVFENGALLVVVSFDAAVAEQEGDLTGYMNELARLNSVPGSWQLCKSTANWGQVQVHATHKSPGLPVSVLLRNIARTVCLHQCKIPICNDMMMLVLCVLYIGPAVSAINHCVATTVLPAGIKQYVLPMSNSHKARLAPEWLVSLTTPSTAVIVMLWLTHAAP